MTGLIIFLLVIIFFKWVVFVLFSPLIRIKSKIVARHKRVVTAADSFPSKRRKWLKKLIGRYYLGLIRYYDIQVGMLPSHRLRNFIYKTVFGVRMAENAVIYFGSEIRAHENLVIGRGSIIGDKAILDARNGIRIGENVNFSSGVSIWTEQHDHRDPYFKCNSSEHFEVVIKDRAWIGPNVIILHSVTIGEGAVVGAGSVVTKNVSPYTVVGGIPAKEINKRTSELKYTFDGEYMPFL